jgi:CheY-like chemotaxis protein
MFKRVLGEDIILQVECPPHLPPVLADPGALEQVTMNLVLNARDAMPRGGNLRIETTAALIEASYVQHNPEARIGLFVCLSVTDTGCGMDAETMSRAFEPFFTTKATKGTGLGLATVYGLVKQHEGWVEVESEVGRGSRFRVFIPAIEALPESQETGLPDVSSQVMGEGTILVAEDDESLRRLMCVILRQCGYTVFEAASGTEALHLWSQRTEAVHLLITDLVMPGGVGGLELARTLKSVDPGLKVVYTSGYYVDLPESETEGGRKPIFLRKPFSPDGLARAAKDALGSS